MFIHTQFQTPNLLSPFTFIAASMPRTPLSTVHNSRPRVSSRTCSLPVLLDFSQTNDGTLRNTQDVERAPLSLAVSTSRQDSKEQSPSTRTGWKCRPESWAVARTRLTHLACAAGLPWQFKGSQARRPNRCWNVSQRVRHPCV